LAGEESALTYEIFGYLNCKRADKMVKNKRMSMRTGFEHYPKRPILFNGEVC